MAHRGANSDHGATRECGHDSGADRASDRHRQEQSKQKPTAQDRNRWRKQELGRASRWLLLDPVAFAPIASVVGANGMRGAASGSAPTTPHRWMGAAILALPIAHALTLAPWGASASAIAVLTRPVWIAERDLNETLRPIAATR